MARAPAGRLDGLATTQKPPNDPWDDDSVLGWLLVRLPAKAGLHDDIVRVSIQLGSELGEEGLTMRAIAARLGVSATALYQHFESKAAILREIRVLGVRLLGEAQRPAFDLEDPSERIMKLGRCYVDFALGNPWLYKVLFHEEEIDWVRASSEERDGILAPLDQIRRVFVEGVQSGGLDSQLDVDHASLLLLAALHGLASLLVNGRIAEDHPAFPVPDRDRFVGNVLGNLVRGFRA